jgi:hypothetical protein
MKRSKKNIFVGSYSTFFLQVFQKKCLPESPETAHRGETLFLQNLPGELQVRNHSSAAMFVRRNSAEEPYIALQQGFSGELQVRKHA